MSDIRRDLLATTRDRGSPLGRCSSCPAITDRRLDDVMCCSLPGTCGQRGSGHRRGSERWGRDRP